MYAINEINNNDQVADHNFSCFCLGRTRKPSWFLSTKTYCLGKIKDLNFRKNCNNDKASNNGNNGNNVTRIS